MWRVYVCVSALRLSIGQTRPAKRQLTLNNHIAASLDETIGTYIYIAHVDRFTHSSQSLGSEVFGIIKLEYKFEQNLVYM